MNAGRISIDPVKPKEGTVMNKILIAIDDRPYTFKAVDYVAGQFAGIAGLQITLLHVLPNLPAIFWDEGHILNDEEKKDRKKVVDSWTAGQKKKIEPLFRKAVDALTAAGMQQNQIQTKFIADSTDVADSILEEAKDGGYRTIVMGRRGAAAGKSVFLGSVTDKVIRKGAGVAVCVVE